MITKEEEEFYNTLRSFDDSLKQLAVDFLTYGRKILTIHDRIDNFEVPTSMTIRKLKEEIKGLNDLLNDKDKTISAQSTRINELQNDKRPADGSLTIGDINALKKTNESLLHTLNIQQDMNNKLNHDLIHMREARKEFEESERNLKQELAECKLKARFFESKATELKKLYKDGHLRDVERQLKVSYPIKFIK